MFKAPLAVKKDTSLSNSPQSHSASRSIQLKVRDLKPVTPRPKWNQQSVHSSAKPNSSLSSIHSSPLTPHPRLLIEKSVNQLRGTTTTSSIETRTKVSKDTTTLSFKQKLMMVNDENNPMNLKDDLINDKQTIQKLCQECVRLQNIVDEQACEIAKLVLRAKADEESRKKVDDITENMNDLIV